MTWSDGWRPSGILHSSNEPGELSKWPRHDESTINIAISISISIISNPHPSRSSFSKFCLVGHWPTLFSSMSLAAHEGRKPDSLNLEYLRQQGRGLEKKLEVFFRTFCFQILYVLAGCTSLHFLQLIMSRTAASRATFVNPGPESVAGLTTSGRINLVFRGDQSHAGLFTLMFRYV